MRTPHHALTLIVALVLAACGGAEPAATTPPPPPAGTAAPAPSSTAAASATPAANTGAPTMAFSAMTKDQQFQHMKTVIKPTMGKLFAAYDAKEFGDFGCATCHGPNKEDTHKALPKLTLSGDGFKKLAAEKPAIMKFMAEVVTPQMATSMGEKPFDPATHQGFGCGGCHQVQ
jgi:cytochrome c551/c552